MKADSADVQPLDALHQDAGLICIQVKHTHRAVTFTVNGQPEFVLQESSEYQRLLDLAALADVNEAIRQGLADAGAGRSQPAEEVFAELRAKYDIPG